MSVVTTDIKDDLAIVRVNNPPVNALSHAVRSGLLEACNSLEQNDAVKAVVLICEGRTFIAGADIREFNQTPQEPHLPDVISTIEKATKPWVAAIHGTALGGGCEVTLGCHYRIATLSAKFGLPEVHLGLIPGAGGTVRMPRLISTTNAIELVTSGKPISSERGKEIGLVDRLTEDHELEVGAIEFASMILSQPMPKAVSLREVIEAPDEAEHESIIAGIEAKARGQISPVEAAKSILDATILPASDAFLAERERFVSLKESPQSAALRHVFFAERQTSKIDEIANEIPIAISQCGVVGGGTMGAGISAAMLLAGYHVVMLERDEASAASGYERVQKILHGSMSRGLISKIQYEELLDIFSAETNYAALKNCDLVVEAVFEDMKTKKAVFQELEKACRKNAILASNTSYLNVNEIAASIQDGSRVLGLHFFSPAHVMKLVEVIKTDSVSQQTLATGFAVAKKLRKVPVISGVCDGFIGNRILANYRKQCDYMLEDGASPQEIDLAMRNFGMAMGPFEMQDMAGLDIGWANRKRLAPTRDPNERYVKIADRLCEMGRFGQKTQAGWYQYPDGGRKGIPDSIVEEVITEERAAADIQPRSFTMAEIQSRILQAMVSEGQKILNEGIARSAADIDMVFILGYGFPRWRGGPMFAGGVID